MNNPILGALNQNRLLSQIAPIKGMINMVRTASNPQAMLNQLMQNNPQYAQVQKLISDNGGDAKAAFYQLAQKSGIDPEQIINALK